MNCHRRNVIVRLGLTLMLAFMLGASAGCIYQGSPLMDLIIENQTKRVLKIAVNDYPVGEVQPSAQITRKNVDMNMGEYVVEAKNAQGEVVFSETYTFNPNDKHHLQKMGDRVYKAVIPPLENDSESSDNITLNK